MNKIIDVVKKMVINPSKISDIEKKLNKFNFSYKGYMWSIWSWTSQNSDESGISVAYYPLAKSILEIQSQKDYMVYSSDEVTGGQVFNQLYNIIKERYLGVDKAFDEMLKD